MRLILVICALTCLLRLDQPIHALLIIKFHRVSTEFYKQLQKVSDYTLQHPLRVFNPRQRRILCDFVILASKFVLYDDNAEDLKTIPYYEWAFVYMFNESINYQRTNVAQTSIVYQYTPYLTLVGRNRRYVEALPCVNTAEVHWYVTFGMWDKYMYLLERGTHKNKNVLHSTAIIEPRALLSSVRGARLSDILFTQIHGSKKRGEHDVRGVLLPESLSKLLCSLSRNDHTRVCSSVFDVLSANNYLEGINRLINYVTVNARRCRKRFIRLLRREKRVAVEVSSCSINTNIMSPQFYLLADSSELGSVFVFLPIIGTTHLNPVAQIRKIGALLNPITQ